MQNPEAPKNPLLELEEQQAKERKIQQQAMLEEVAKNFGKKSSGNLAES